MYVIEKILKKVPTFTCRESISRIIIPMMSSTLSDGKDTQPYKIILGNQDKIWDSAQTLSNNFKEDLHRRRNWRKSRNKLRDKKFKKRRQSNLDYNLLLKRKDHKLNLSKLKINLENYIKKIHKLQNKVKITTLFITIKNQNFTNSPHQDRTDSITRYEDTNHAV